MGRTSISDTDAAKDYMFHFDTSMEPLVFDEFALSGWLLHRDRKPIKGIRAIVKRKFARRKTFGRGENDAGRIWKLTSRICRTRK